MINICCGELYVHLIKRLSNQLIHCIINELMNSYLRLLAPLSSSPITHSLLDAWTLVPHPVLRPRFLSTDLGSCPPDKSAAVTMSTVDGIN